MVDAVGSETIDHILKRIQVDRRQRSSDEFGHSGGFADIFRVAGKLSQSIFGRCEILWPVPGENCWSVAAKFQFDRRLILCSAKAVWKAPVNKTPAFVSSCSEKDGDTIESPLFVQEARLIRDLQAIDNRTPMGAVLDKFPPGNGRQRTKHLISRLGSHARKNLRRIRTTESGCEIIALRLCFFSCFPST